MASLKDLSFRDYDVGIIGERIIGAITGYKPIMLLLEGIGNSPGT